MSDSIRQMWEVKVILILTVLACLMINSVQFDVSHEEKGSVLHYKATFVDYVVVTALVMTWLWFKIGLNYNGYSNGHQRRGNVFKLISCNA